MAEERGSLWSNLKSFIFGSLAGVVLGMLFAPKAGKELRKDIRSKTDDMIERGKESYQTQSKKVQEALETSKQAAAQKSNEIKEKIEETREKVRQGIDSATDFARHKIGIMSQEQKKAEETGKGEEKKNVK